MGSDAVGGSSAPRALTNPTTASGLSTAEVLDWIAEVTHCEQPRVVERVRLAALRADWSPRAAGLDADHVSRLVEADGPLPPIYVHRDTMQIVDGHHRAAAAAAKGQPSIEAYLIKGAAELIFVIAVSANVMHGLPLSLKDRKAAARTLLGQYPSWSDRAIADAAGVSARTVNQLRCATEQDPQLHTPVGRDGRRRPQSTANGRRTAAELLTAHPGASLRQIAKLAGISPGTVRDVRLRLSRGEDPVPQGRQLIPPPTPDDAPTTRCAAGREADGQPLRPGDTSALVQSLARDPALRLSAGGRDLLRWLHIHSVDAADGTNLVRLAPEHSLERMIDFANRCSRNWAAVAEDIRRRIDAR